MRVGIEGGGTFTDLVAQEGGRIAVVKVPSPPASPDVGAFAALGAGGIDASEVSDLVHGSTVATNAILERKGARVAFVTTRGFRDILFLQRHDRHNIHDLRYRKPGEAVAIQRPISSGARGVVRRRARHCRIFRAGGTIEMRSKGKVALLCDDVVELAMGGGAGYGDPALRPADRVAADRLDCYLT